MIKWSIYPGQELKIIKLDTSDVIFRAFWRVKRVLFLKDIHICNLFIWLTETHNKSQGKIDFVSQNAEIKMHLQQKTDTQQ